jgi:hypothetical protein
VAPFFFRALTTAERFLLRAPEVSVRSDASADLIGLPRTTRLVAVLAASFLIGTFLAVALFSGWITAAPSLTAPTIAPADSIAPLGPAATAIVPPRQLATPVPSTAAAPTAGAPSSAPTNAALRTSVPLLPVQVPAPAAPVVSAPRAAPTLPVTAPPIVPSAVPSIPVPSLPVPTLRIGSVAPEDGSPALSPPPLSK